MWIFFSFLSWFAGICIKALLTAFKWVTQFAVLYFAVASSSLEELGTLKWSNEKDRPKMIQNFSKILSVPLLVIIIIIIVSISNTNKYNNAVKYTNPYKKNNTTTTQTTKAKSLETTKAPTIIEETTLILPETTTIQAPIETTIAPQPIIETIIPQTINIVETNQVIEQTTTIETIINNEHSNDNFYINGNLDTYTETFDIEEDYSSKATLVIPKIEGKDAEKVAKANEFINSAKEDIIGEFENILTEVSPAYKSLSIIQSEVNAQSSNRLKITLSGTLKTNSGTSKSIKYIFTYDVENDDYEIERKD